MKKILLPVIAVLISVSALKADTFSDYKSASDNILSFGVDSIDYRDDLTRIYGKIIGRPHTSNRIDYVKLIGAGMTAGTTDIDGVDFKRYFQWEDDGTIPIEIDFPALKPTDELQIIFTTSKGSSTTTVKKIVRKHK